MRNGGRNIIWAREADSGKISHRWCYPFIAEENEDGILEVTIVQKAEAEVKRQKLNHEGRPSSTYEKVFHVIPTSNICERLFSRAKLVLSDRRKNLTFTHFEILIFLWLNKDMWDIKTVQRCSTRKECENEIHFERFDMDLNDVNMDVAADLSMDEA